jgi:hypothetical protein
MGCASLSWTCGQKLIEHQREAIWLEWMVFLPVYGMAVYVIISTAMGG